MVDLHRDALFNAFINANAFVTRFFAVFRGFPAICDG